MSGTASKKKNRQKRTLTILLLALALLGIALLVFVFAKNQPITNTITTVERYTVFEPEAGTIERITWTGKSAEPITIYRDGDVWKIENDDREAVQSVARMVLMNASKILARKELEDPDLEATGLDRPEKTVTVVANGERYVFDFGSETQFRGEYYMRFDNKVYVVDGFVRSGFDVSIYQLTGASEDEIFYDGTTEAETE